MNFSDNLELAKNISKEAGDILTKHRLSFRKEIREEKSPDTVFDRLIGSLIREELQRVSGYFTYSEGYDNPNERVKKNTFWWIDPIDGTRSFVRGESFYSISISLIVSKTPMVGVIYQPHVDSRKMYSAIEGAGSYVEDLTKKTKHKINTSSRKVKLKAVVGNSTKEDVGGFYDSNNFSYEGPFGSFTHKALMIATGEADVYIKASDKCNEWDSAAAWRIIKEAGGEMTFFNGKSMEYNNPDPRQRGGVLITNGHCHDSLVDKIKDHFRA